MKNIFTATLTALALISGPAVAQSMNCYGSYCSGTTRNGQSVQLNTYGNYTSGSLAV